jgi:hypothetical protein
MTDLHVVGPDDDVDFTARTRRPSRAGRAAYRVLLGLVVVAFLLMCAWYVLEEWR